MSNPGPQPFAYRQPSVTWEQVPLPGQSGHCVWVWFRPPQMSNGVIVRLPPELDSYPGRAQLTVRWLLSLTGMDVQTLALWYVFGTPYQNAPNMQPALDAAIPQAPTGAQPEIAFVAHVAAPMMPQPMPMGMPVQSMQQMGHMQQPMVPQQQFDGSVPRFSNQSVAMTADAEKLLHRIESEWQSCITLERQLAGVRKKVTGLLSKIQGLDRELSPEERLHADNADVKDWQEARRWLKDVSNRANRYVKEHDIGVTSMAGRRKSFEETYRTVIEPKRPVAGLDNMLREFDSYRKSLNTLLNNMNNAYQTASQEGERRATRVLGRIRAKARNAKSTVSRKRT